MDQVIELPSDNPEKYVGILVITDIFLYQFVPKNLFKLQINCLHTFLIQMVRPRDLFILYCLVKIDSIHLNVIQNSCSFHNWLYVFLYNVWKRHVYLEDWSLEKDVNDIQAIENRTIEIKNHFKKTILTTVEI